MRVAIVSPVYPWPTNMGNRVRILNMAKEIARRHEVTLLALAQQDTTQDAMRDAESQCGELGVTLRSVRRAPRSLVMRARDRVRSDLKFRFGAVLRQESWYGCVELLEAAESQVAETHPDVVLFNYWFTTQPLISRLRVPSICDTHDVLSEGYARARFGSDISLAEAMRQSGFVRRLATREKMALERYSALIAVSDRDAASIRQQLAVTIPTTAITTLRSQEPLSYVEPGVGRDRILFYGALQSRMNSDAARVAALKVLPLVRQQRPDATLTIAGSWAASATRDLGLGENTRFVGEVEDLATLLHSADVLILPLSTGSGVKGRVLEAMQAGLPIVGSSLAFEGLGVASGEDVVSCDDWHEMANLVASLLGSQRERRALARRARASVQREFSWENTYGRIHEVLDSVIGGS